MPSWFTRAAGNDNNNAAYGNRSIIGNGQNYPQGNRQQNRSASSQAEAHAKPYFNNSFVSRLFGNGTGRNPTPANQPGGTQGGARGMQSWPPANSQMGPWPQQSRQQANNPMNPPPLHSSRPPSAMPSGQRGMDNALQKPLPDGVRYEPLDETTKNLVNQLKRTEHNPAGMPGNPGQSPIAPQGNPEHNPGSLQGMPGLMHPPPAPAHEMINGGSPAPDMHAPWQQSLSRKMEGLIQNERNAALFYGYLARKATREEYRRALDSISSESRNRHGVYNSIYANYNGQAYLPKDTEINNNVSFHNGIAWAIAEESRALAELSSIYEEIADEKLAKSIGTLIYKKISDISILHLMNTNRGLYY